MEDFKMNRQREENMDIQKVLSERVKEVMHKVRKEVAIPQGWDLVHQGIIYKSFVFQFIINSLLFICR